MFSFLKRKRRASIVVQEAEPISAAFENVWVRKRMPDPGAQNYAFESEMLPLQTPIGAGVAVRHPTRPIQNGAQPYFPVQHTSLQGFGQVSGALVSQPLFNPRFPVYGAVSPMTNNDVGHRAEILPAGSAFP